MAQRVIQSPITTLGLDPAYRMAIRGFEKVVMRSASEIRDYIPMLYTAKKFEPRTITFPVYAGVPAATQWNGQSVIQPASLAYLYDITATVTLWGQSIEHTFEGMEFDFYSLGNTKATELGKAMQVARQAYGADFFNAALAASANWVDGVPFFSSSHPYDSRSDLAIAGTTADNLVSSGALSLDKIMEAMYLATNMKDPLGRPIVQTPTTIFCHPDAYQKFQQYMNPDQPLRSGTANNDRNPLKDFGQPNLVVYPWFDSSSYWMLKTNSAKTFHCPRIPIKMLEPEKTSAHGVKQDAIFCEGFWAEDFTGWIGGVNAP